MLGVHFDVGLVFVHARTPKVQAEGVPIVDEGGDEEQQLHRAQAGYCAHVCQASCGSDACALGQAAPGDGAVLAVDNAAVVAAVVHLDVVDERAAQGGIGSHGCQPEDAHQEIKRQDSPYVIGGIGGRHLLGHEGICGDDEREEALER